MNDRLTSIVHALISGAVAAGLILGGAIFADASSAGVIAEHADVQHRAQAVVASAWTTEALLTQAELVWLSAPFDDDSRGTALAAVLEAADRLEADSIALYEVAPGTFEDEYQPARDVRTAASALEAGITGTSQVDRARATLLATVASANAELEARLTAIGLASTDAGRAATATRWLIAVIVPATMIVWLRARHRKRERKLELEHELETERRVRASKIDFLDAVVHHLRAPLRTVVELAESLRTRSDTFNARQRRDLVETIADQAHDLEYLIEDLDVVGQPEDAEVSWDPAPCDVRRTVEAVLAGLGMQHSESVVVLGSGAATADETRIRQILRNLISNAVESSAEYVAVVINEGEDALSITVSDDGPRRACGEELFSLTADMSCAEDTAAALGLSLSRRLARIMGGDLVFVDEPDVTTFRLTLPAADLSLVVRELADGSVLSTRDVLAAVERANFQIAFQPIFDLAAPQRLLGFEALSRFPSATPDRWFGAAARLGVGVDLELTAIRKAVRQFSSFGRTGYLAVNVSDEALLSTTLVEALRGVPPERVVLELSEDAVIANFQRTREAIDRLRARGYRLALDDVGSRDVDLWMIAGLRPEIIKLDKSLLEEDSAPSVQAVLGGLVEVARRLGASVVAEGIETEAHLAAMRSLGATAGQGYFLGRPATPADSEFEMYRLYSEAEAIKAS